MYQQAMDLTREAVRLAPRDTTLGRKLYYRDLRTCPAPSRDFYRYDEVVAEWRRSTRALASIAHANPDVPDVQAVYLQASTALARHWSKLNAESDGGRGPVPARQRKALDHLLPRDRRRPGLKPRDEVALADAWGVPVKPKLARDESLARDDQLDRAVDDLRQAVAAGWRGLPEVKGASPLKSRPAYAYLLAEAEAAAAIPATSPLMSALAAFPRSAGTLAPPSHSQLDLKRKRPSRTGAVESAARFQEADRELGREALERSLGRSRGVRAGATA